MRDKARSNGEDTGIYKVYYEAHGFLCITNILKKISSIKPCDNRRTASSMRLPEFTHSRALPALPPDEVGVKTYKWTNLSSSFSNK